MQKKAQQNLMKVSYNLIKANSEVVEQHLAGAFTLLFEEVISNKNGLFKNKSKNFGYVQAIAV